MNQLAYLMAVTIIRESQGFLLNSHDDLKKMSTEKIDYIKNYESYIYDIVQPLQSIIPNNWFKDFSCSIFWWKFGFDNEQERKNVNLQSLELICAIQNSLNIPISEKSTKEIMDLMEYIYIKNKIYPYKKYMIYNRYLYSSKAIKEHIVEFETIFRATLVNLEKKCKFPWATLYSEEMLYEITIRWNDLPSSLEKIRIKLSVAILSDLGNSHGNLLASILKKNFYNKINVFVLSKESLHELNLEHTSKYDLYISNYTLKNVCDDRVFIVDDIPSLENLMDLRETIDKRRPIPKK